MHRLFRISCTGILVAIFALPLPLSAKDSLGIFGFWGTFRDMSVPRCYAIAKPEHGTDDSDHRPYVTIGTWPLRNIRNQIHFRLSRNTGPNAAISLSIDGKPYTLTGGGGDAWAKDQTMDAAIVSSLRSSRTMVIRSRDKAGRRFFDTYRLDGVASAIDAATVGCARRAS